MRSVFVAMIAVAISTSVGCCIASATEAEPEGVKTIEFEGKHWVADSADRVTVGDHKGRTALCVRGGSKSYVYLSDVAFADGTIEVDIATMSRSIPGIGFHGHDQGVWLDRVMLSRWHRSSQTEPTIIEQANIARHHGTLLFLRVGVNEEEGSTERRTLGEWFHMKVTVRDQTLSVYLDDDTHSSIEVHKMFDGAKSGTIGVCGSNFYFTNFRYTPTE